MILGMSEKLEDISNKQWQSGGHEREETAVSWSC